METSIPTQSHLFDLADQLAERDHITPDEALHDLGAMRRFESAVPGRPPVYIMHTDRGIRNRAAALAEWRLGTEAANEHLRRMIVQDIAGQIAAAVAGTRDLKRAACRHAAHVNRSGGWTVNIDRDGTAAAFHGVTLPAGQAPDVILGEALAAAASLAYELACDACPHPDEHRVVTKWADICKCCDRHICYHSAS